MSFACFDWSKKPQKCAVIGCHAMGAAIAHALAESSLFDAIVLLDDDKRLAEGQAADLACALPLHASVDIWAGEYSDLQGCAMIVLACGLIPMYETVRSELPALNLPMMRRAVANIAAHAGDAVMVVASEPVDLMTYTALRYSDFPSNRVFGLGTLPDTLRLRRLLARYLTADPAQVHAMMLGEAGEHATVLWSDIRIAGVDLDTYRSSLGRSTDALILHSLFDDVLAASARITDAKGHADFSVASAALLIADAIIHDRNTLLPLSVVTKDPFGIGKLCMSLPCVLGLSGIIATPEPCLAPTEQAQLEKSAARFRASLYELEQMLATT